VSRLELAATSVRSASSPGRKGLRRDFAFLNRSYGCKDYFQREVQGAKSIKRVVSCLRKAEVAIARMPINRLVGEVAECVPCFDCGRGDPLCRPCRRIDLQPHALASAGVSPPVSRVRQVESLVCAELNHRQEVSGTDHGFTCVESRLPYHQDTPCLAVYDLETSHFLFLAALDQLAGISSCDFRW
jgi:hypothetical protein